MSKIKDEQLEKLQGLVAATNQVQMQLGQLDMQKHALLHQGVEIQEELGKFQKELDQIVKEGGLLEIFSNYKYLMH